MRAVATKRVTSTIALAALLWAAPALAQTPQERRYCEGEDGTTIEQRIAGCSAVIRAGKDKGDKLAEATTAAASPIACSSRARTRAGRRRRAA